MCLTWAGTTIVAAELMCGQLLTRRRPHTGECIWGLQRGVTFNNERSHLG